MMWSTYDSLAKISEHALNLQRGARTVAHRSEVLTMNGLPGVAKTPAEATALQAVEPSLGGAGFPCSSSKAGTVFGRICDHGFLI